MTLRLRLAVAAALVLVVVVVAGFILIRTVEASQLQQIDHRMEAVIPVVLNLVQPPGPGLAPFPPAPGNAITDVYVAKITNGRRIVIVSPGLARGAGPTTPSSSSGIGPVSVRAETVSSESGSGRWRATVIRAPGSTTRVLVAISLTRVDATTQRLRDAVLGAGLLVLAVLVAAGVWLERLGFRRIREITEVADAIAGGDRSRRVRAASSGTEAAHLGRAFNIMLDEQQATEGRLRQFVADASHELRTPVTAIRGFTELWAGGHLRTGPPLDDVMRRIGQESARMAGLVEDLLLLARLDEGRASAHAPVDMTVLVRDAAVDAGATHPGRPIRISADHRVVVEGDELALRQVVANLVTNALVHTPATSFVSVAIREVRATAVLQVADDGPGMARADAARAFDRFWRADASRSRVGAGLGLSIVASVVAAHRGEVTMATDPGSGTVVRVALPLAGDSQADGRKP